MKLTDSDKSLLTGLGYEEKDMDQIEQAIGKTVFLLNFESRISSGQALSLLGREKFLSGMGRCAFHRSAVRSIGDSLEDHIYFDASGLFKEKEADMDGGT